MLPGLYETVRAGLGVRALRGEEILFHSSKSLPFVSGIFTSFSRHRI